jgi:nitroimidazol reductase NimA-like FMN-containing flavoprotein (pyridoxamine 5'-phosphate oxidase superfamily)
VNFRCVRDGSQLLIAVRTRPGNVIDRAGPAVAFEIDGIDQADRTGWSVLVRGTLQHVEAEKWRGVTDPRPWLSTNRNSWLAILAHQVTGRRITAADPEWPPHAADAV